MERISKHKETIIFASCATALVGGFLLLQKATTPSQHRRHAGSSASRGVPRSRSASRGPATGPRSRTSSRVKGRHASDKESGAVTASTNLVTAVSAGDRGHSSRSRDASQPHPHRHHSHPRAITTNGTAILPAVNPADALNSTAGKPSKAAAAAPKKALTVEAVVQHTKALGIANTLQKPDRTNPFDPQNLHRNARTSGGGRTGAGGSASVGDDNANYRSASNAATVGSQAFFGTSVALPALAASASCEAREADVVAEEKKAGLPPRSPRLDSANESKKQSDGLLTSQPPQQESSASRHRANIAPQTESATTAPMKPAVEGIETQTSARWFCNDHGTQTEPATADERRMYSETGVTPDRWMHAAMMSPIVASGEGNDSAILNSTEFGWTPVREADETKVMNTAAALLADKSACFPAVPRYFLSRLEAAIRTLVQDATRNNQDERSWMRLYEYLAELPLSVRKALAKRARCGVTPAFTSLATTLTHGLAHTFPTVNEEAAPATPTAPSLPQEVLHLLQDGTLREPTSHFEWQAGRCVWVKGALVPCAATVPNDGAVTCGDRDRSTRFSHVQLSPTASSLSSREDANPIDDENAEVSDDGFADVVKVAKHLEKYRYVLQADTPAPLRNEPNASEEVAGAPLYKDDTTPLKGGDAKLLEEALRMQEQLHRQQQHLVSFLSAFLQLKQTERFQAMRQSTESAPFACDFIELAASAQHYLESTAPFPELSSSLLQLQVPATQRRVVRSESTDVHDTSIGTTTSARSDSSPNSAMAQHGRRNVKARTPMKPSIRYPIQQVLSSSPSPIAAAHGTVIDGARGVI